MALNFKTFVSFMALLIFAALVFLAVSNPGGAAQEANGLSLNQTYIEGIYSNNLDLENVREVFWRVFSQLPEEVTVYPTENYYYFSFYASGKNLWGNLRLSPEDRDRGILHFAYWEFNENPISPDDFFSRYRALGPEDGVLIRRVDDFKYIVSYADRSIVFNLRQLPQDPPRLFRLRKNEEFLLRTFDESGFRFFLIFDKSRPHFMYMLNEEEGLPDELVSYGDSASGKILFGKRTGFGFYDDRENNRKILIGVSAENIKRNNYFDGPFDQLADNYMGPGKINLGRYIEKAYPYTQGRIDEYGKFTDVDGSRVAITPYYDYYGKEELVQLAADCEKDSTGAEFYQCITYDDKENF